MLKTIIPCLSLIIFSSFMVSSDGARAMDEAKSEAAMHQALQSPRRQAYQPTLSSNGEKPKMSPRKPAFEATLAPLVEKNEKKKTLTSPRKVKSPRKDKKTDS